MRALIALALGLVAQGASAATLSQTLCAPYEKAWAQASAQGDLAHMTSVARSIPTGCDVRARALGQIERLRSLAARPTRPAPRPAPGPSPPDPELARYGWPYAGLETLDLNEILAAPLGLSGRQGAYVVFVERGQPAAAAGLAKGDVVVAANNRPVRSASDLVEAIKQAPADETIALVALRAHQTSVVLVRLARPGRTIIEFRKAEEAVRAGEYARAVAPLTTAASAGMASAQLVLCRLYETGSGVTADYATALKWCRLSADQGYVTAEEEMGVFYANALGVPRDDRRAMSWFRLAANEGYAPAQFSVGAAYAFGQGVQQDYGEAMRWYLLAAGQGDADAANNIGVLHAGGFGVPVDLVEAVRWYQTAAERGSTKGQYNLGMAYATGKGVMQDIGEARTWMAKAANDDQGAAEWLKAHPP
jgi:TPR repeat protein